MDALWMLLLPFSILMLIPFYGPILESLTRWTARRRAARLRPWARRHGWHRRERHEDLAPYVAGVAPLDGSRREFLYAMHGRVGAAPAVLFQLDLDVQGRRRHHAVLVVDAPAMSPGLAWAAEDTLARRTDRQDIDFESHAFSRRFWVRATDRRFAYDVMHPRMMEYMMRWRRPYWDWSEGRLRVLVPGPLEPGRCSELVEAAHGFLELVPRHLRPTRPAPAGARSPP